MLDAARGFFRERGVLEVETPVALAATVTDVQIESLQLAGEPARWLHTSPEYPMKRLLAAGSGDIFQLCHVFRAGEAGRLHNPEFTMLEWYRLGMGLPAIMAETVALVGVLLATAGRAPGPMETLRYAQAFQRELGCDPLEAAEEQLAGLALTHGPWLPAASPAPRAMTCWISSSRPGSGPALGRGRLTCLHHFPASQAALAQLESADPRTALRFELYAEGVGTGQWLCRAGKPRRAATTFRRGSRRTPAARTHPAHRGRAAAGRAGRRTAACAGVAVGFDRVAMLALGATSIAEVMAFPWNRA